MALQKIDNEFCNKFIVLFIYENQNQLYYQVGKQEFDLVLFFCAQRSKIYTQEYTQKIHKIKRLR